MRHFFLALFCWLSFSAHATVDPALVQQLAAEESDDKIPRKGGPGITKSDLLVINKIDLAPLVGASLDVMDRDAKKMRGGENGRPFIFSNMKTGQGLAEIIAFIAEKGMLPVR